MFLNVLFLALVLASALLAFQFLRANASRRRASGRTEDFSEREPEEDYAADYDESRTALWLSRAGFRDPSVAGRFWSATVAAAALGLLCFYLLDRFQSVAYIRESLVSIPGGVGDALGYFALAIPYILFLICLFAPALWVRAARRARIEAIERDLAPTLELLATLAEAGLGFDGAIARIQASEPAARPLHQEFEIYRRDALGGIARTESLRRLATRVHITSVSIFVSALIQAELVGSSLAETLRTQADDLRDRRKLRALLLAQALPVKLAFPLMICFLPGIFYSTLGPVLAQLVDVVDSVIQKR